jgi:hypothetical protein
MFYVDLMLLLMHNIVYYYYYCCYYCQYQICILPYTAERLVPPALSLPDIEREITRWHFVKKPLWKRAMYLS